MKQRYLEAGKIVNTFGVRGEVKIEPWADSPDFLQDFETLYIDGEPRKLLSGRAHNKMFIALLEGVPDLNAAMALKNRIVCIDRNDVHLPEGSYFLADIVGAAVVDEDGRSIGTLTEVLELPAGNVFVVRGEDGEHTIPAVPEFIRNVDVDNGVVRVHLIEGM